MPFVLLNRRWVAYETEKNKAPSARDRAWSEVFRVVVEGGKPIPEESCHKCVRLYGIFTGEMTTASTDSGASDTDADYVAGDLESAVDTIELMATDGCVDEGTLRDAKEIMKFEEKEDYDMDDVESAISEIEDLPILDQVVHSCKVGTVSR